MFTPFGKLPSGKRLQEIQRSPNYKNGQFQNLSDTPSLTDGAKYYKVLWDFIFGKDKNNKPSSQLPSQKTNLLSLPPDKDVLVWFGHSSYFIQVDGTKILVDPVFGGSASPLPNSVKSFKGSNVYGVDDLPEIDYLFISHDHWDHLDYPTILKLKPKVKKIITAIGVGSHLEAWGYDMNNVIEKGWNEEVTLDEGFVVNTTPARHFSGRGLKRNQSLWLSFALKTPTMNIFLGGDSGYDSHFTAIGEKFGPFDLAILECGQYNRYWKHIHMMPEEVVKAAIDLKAKKLLPVHWSKFALGLHAWDDPIKRVTAEGKKQNMPIMTPMIGEEVNLNESKLYPAWWEGIK